jgi:hypothetical protein
VTIIKDGCIGASEHVWHLGISEGSIYIDTKPCGPTCRFVLQTPYGPMTDIGDDINFLEMEPMQVNLFWSTDCPAYDLDDRGAPIRKHQMSGYEHGSHYIVHGSRCDCNWWPVATPVIRKE